MCRRGHEVWFGSVGWHMLCTSLGAMTIHDNCMSCVSRHVFCVSSAFWPYSLDVVSYGCLECLLSSFNIQTYIILIILLHLFVLDAISRCCHTKSAWRFVHVRMKKRFKPRVVFSVSPSLPREKCMQTYHKSIQWCCKSISAFTSSFPRRFSAML